MTICVIGGGHAGLAVASHLTLLQHDVHLVAQPDHPGFIPHVQAAEGIMVEAVPNEHNGIFARVHRADTEIEEALRECEYVIVTLPANAREHCFELIAKFVPDGRTVWVMPDKFGVLRLGAVMANFGRSPDDVLLCGSDTFLFIAKVHEGNHVWLRGRKGALELSTLPHDRFSDALGVVRDVYPEAVSVPTVFHTSLGSSSSALHPTTLIYNLAKIENEGPFPVNNYDISPGMGRMIDALDAERVALAASLGVEVPSFLDNWRRFYGLTGDNAYEMISSSTGHQGQISPSTAKHRYIEEDVPFGLVPLAALGAAIGMPMPVTDSLITTASVINDVDYRSIGATLEWMGLAGNSAQRLTEFLGPISLGDRWPF